MRSSDVDGLDITVPFVDILLCSHPIQLLDLQLLLGLLVISTHIILIQQNKMRTGVLHEKRI